MSRRSCAVLLFYWQNGLFKKFATEYGFNFHLKAFLALCFVLYACWLNVFGCWQWLLFAVWAVVYVALAFLPAYHYHKSLLKLGYRNLDEYLSRRGV